MRWPGRSLIAGLLGLAALSASAQDVGQPFLRVAVQPRTAIVGQPVRVAVEVAVPNWFLAEPQYPALDIPGAVAVLPEETPVNSSERVGGRSYSAIKRTYLVYPQQPGEFTLPPAQVTVTYALQGGASSPPVNLALPPERFEAAIPEEAAGLGYFLPTTRFSLTQAFDPPTAGLRVGSSFVRTVTATAAQTFSMFIPPARFDCPRGLKAYPKDPVVQDQKQEHAGFTGGSRVDAVTYLVLEPGTYTLPGLSVSWWDLNAGKLRTTTVPSVTFTAAPNPDYRPAIAPEAPPVPVAQGPKSSPWGKVKRLAPPVGIALLVTLAVLWLAWRYGRRALASLAERRRRRAEGEPARFTELIGACQSGDPRRAYAALALWVERSGAGGAAGPVAAYAERCGDPALREEIGRLASLLYSKDAGGSWDGRRLRDGLTRSRRSMKVAGRRASRRRPRLPDLNPKASSPGSMP